MLSFLLITRRRRCCAQWRSSILEIIDEVVLVDDASSDRTVAVARELGLEPICHEVNRGYGGNQKTCYRQALELGADIIVMVHPDYQYSPLLVPAMASMIAYGEYDMVLGSRILAQDSVARGMPRYKYVVEQVSDVRRKPGAQPEAVGVSHRAAGVQQRAAGRPADRAQLRRFRLRQPDHRPGGPPRERGSARSRARPVMLPTRRRSTCGAASATGSACCAPAWTTGSPAWARAPDYLDFEPGRCPPGVPCSARRAGSSGGGGRGAVG